MSILEAYLLTCDNCHRHPLVYSGRTYLPQEVLTHAIVRKNWTVYGEITHCADCPPLCTRCGKDCNEEPDWCPICAVTSGQG